MLTAFTGDDHQGRFRQEACAYGHGEWCHHPPMGSREVTKNAVKSQDSIDKIEV